MNKGPSMIIFTGTGKGKTTSALGYVLPWAFEKKIKVVQFFKGSSYAAEQKLGNILDNIYFYSFGYGCQRSNLISIGEDSCHHCGKCFRINREQPAFAVKAWNLSKLLVKNKAVDILILDEFAYVLKYNFLSLEEFRSEVSTWSEELILILTGRSFPKRILDMSSEIYELMEVKHPWQQGIPSRRGVEF